MELSGGWNELGGAGWSWVHGLVIPVSKSIVDVIIHVIFQLHSVHPDEILPKT